MQIFTTILKVFISCLKAVLHTIAWLTCVVAITYAINHFLQRQYNIDPNKFTVCVIDKDNHLPAHAYEGEQAYILLSKISNELPCNQPTKDREIWYKADWILKQIDDDEWELHTYMGYWSDPKINHYRVENGKIIPMWYAYTRLGQLFWATLLGLIFTIILYPRLLKLLSVVKKIFHQKLL